MGVMDKFLNYMKLNDEEDEDYLDDDYLDDEDDIEEPAPRRGAAKTRSSKEAFSEDTEKSDRTARKTSQPKVTPIRQSSVKRMSGAGMEVCVIKPTSFDEAREITETLLANRTVVLNLEGLDVDIAQRIIDFTSGSCFAIGGNLQKISHCIFIITPATVDISGDFQDIFGSGGTFEMPIHGGM